LFVGFNQKKGKGAVGYQSGENILIKTNGVGATVAGRNDHSVPSLSNYTMARTSPQPVLAILRQLIDVCGIPQENVSVGDPQRDVQNEYWDIWHSEFPNVSYICHTGGEGRTQSREGSTPIMFYSDRGAVLRSGDWSDASKGTPIYEDKMYTVIEQADYRINVAALKVHERAGRTLLAKCHFGSHARSSALHLHMGLVNPDGLPVADPKRDGYGLYRVLVDLMGHGEAGKQHDAVCGGWFVGRAWRECSSGKIRDGAFQSVTIGKNYKARVYPEVMCAGFWFSQNFRRECS
jgi:hypothetical protein